VIDLLADLQGRDPEEVLTELTEGGQELPVDSLLIVEILTRIEDDLSIRIPADAQAARSTRSVRAFANTILDAIHERQQP
jgi:acyl carrier protein